MATPKIIPYEVQLRSTKIKRNISKPVVYTNDLNSAEFQFHVIDMDAEELATATAITLIKAKDGSFFQGKKEDVGLVGTTFTYTLEENEGNHAGEATIQLIVCFNAGQPNEQNFPSQIYKFEIVNGLDSKVAQEIMIHDWTTLTREARAYIDKFAANEILREAEFDNNEFDRNAAFAAGQTGRTNAFNADQGTRTQTFNADQTTRAQAFSDAQTARTNAYAAAEAGREADFSAAETLRQTGYDEDHSRAGTDHTRADNDHTLAGQDRTKAAEDRTAAASDRTLAGNDRTRAEADHTRAEEDHVLFADMQITHDLDTGKNYKTNLEIYNGQPRLKLEEIV